MENYFLFPFIICCLFIQLFLSLGKDILYINEKITQDNSSNLISNENQFQSGFFSLSSGNSSILKPYFGVWYHDLQPQTIVWVANRDTPLLNSRGFFHISDDGNLAIVDDSRVYWSSNLEGSSTKNITIKLLDSGNLVLVDENQGYLWESFNHPTDTFLPGMTFQKNLSLHSWRDKNDPGEGNFIFERVQNREYTIKNKTQLYWKSGHLEEMSATLILLLEGEKNFPNSSFIHLGKIRLLMSYSGEIILLKWMEELEWSRLWWSPRDVCDIYEYCGTFSTCNKNNWKQCNCLPGFSPRFTSPNHEYSGERFPGCVNNSDIGNLYLIYAHFSNLFLNFILIEK
jgi:hypothetical protein